MKREILITGDGSATIHLPDWKESYHSRHGAVNEAKHVFIKNGLDRFTSPVNILEIGFGTGLNALITLVEAEQRNLKVHYTGIEGFPVSAEEAALLNYPQILGNQYDGHFHALHTASWNEAVAIADYFELRKLHIMFDQIEMVSEFDLIYFDAFGFHVQPELWSAEIFNKMYSALKESGILVTYAARTTIRKNMEAAGFTVEKLPGPPGKREMMRARKDI